MKNSVSYKTINLAASLVWVMSIGAMEQPAQEFVNSQDIKNLNQSIMMAVEDEGTSLKNSRGLFGWISDLYYGIDANVIYELESGTLTKDVVAQNKGLQARACEGTLMALKGKKTEALCKMINEFKKFNMLGAIAMHSTPVTQFLNLEIFEACKQNDSAKLLNILKAMNNTYFVVDKGWYDSITRLLNQEIPTVCNQNDHAKLRDMLFVAKAMKLCVNNDLITIINPILNEQKEQKVAKFEAIVQNQRKAMQEVQVQLEKDKLECNKHLTEASEILVLQHYLEGKTLKKDQVIHALGRNDKTEDVSVLLQSVKNFTEKK